MTKEELEKEAKEKYSKAHARDFGLSYGSYYDGYLASAEPREKQIEELETRCTELFLQNNEFAERFEKSIEIIKGLLSCCRNYPQENAEKIKQAEQFLRETDIDNAIQKVNEGLNLDKIAEEVKQDLDEGCPNILCEDCTREKCTVRKLGLVPTKEIEK